MTSLFSCRDHDKQSPHIAVGSRSPRHNSRRMDIGPTPTRVVSICGDLSHDNSTINAYVNSIEMSLINGTFWPNYTLKRSFANGHCILNSVMMCLNALHTDTYDINRMFLCKKSCLRNVSKI